MRTRSRVAVGLVGAASAALGLFAAGTAANRLISRRIRSSVDADLDPLYALPSDVIRHDVASHDGGNIHVVELGSGRPLVLIHGVTLQAEVWAPMLHLLADRFRVVAVDVRGHGRSVVGQDGIGRRLAARDLATVFEHLDLQGAIVMGHSMGGMILGEFCGDFPDLVSERVAGLVFMSTASSQLVPAALVPFAERIERYALRRVETGRSLPRVMGDNNRSLVATRVAFGSRPSGVAVEQARRLGADVDLSAYLPLWLDLFDYDGEAALAAVDVPALVLVGARDLLTPVSMAKRIDRHLQHSTMLVIPGAGHQLMQERPREVSEAIVDLARGLNPWIEGS
ncbi:MAG: alpha/beta hydrolase [Actinomycetes bacterium]